MFMYKEVESHNSTFQKSILKSKFILKLLFTDL